MSKTQRIIMPETDLNLALQRISLQILEKNHGIEHLALVGIHTCGVHLAERIRKIIVGQMQGEVLSGSLDINLYRDDWSLIAQNPVVKTTNIPFDVDNTNLVLIDDVIFTGRTIRAAMDAIMDYGRPNTIQLAVLIDRGGRELPIQPDFVGMQTIVQSPERIKVLLVEENQQNQVVIER